MLQPERDLEAVRRSLAAWLQTQMPRARELTIAALVRPKAGFSNDTLLFDASYVLDGRRSDERLVARFAPTAFQVFPEYDIAAQALIMQCLEPTDVPVPRVRWLEMDPRFLGQPFYVMDAITGELPSEVPPYHATGFCFEASPARRARIWWSGLETLARIHALEWQTLGLGFRDPPGSGTDAIDRQLAYWTRYLEWTVRGRAPQPILAGALTWLREHRYAPRHVTLCWGDARLPNLIYREDEVVGVLDWEMAFLGDPEADLGWWLFMHWATGEGYGLPPLDGFPGRDETIRRYEAVTGRPVEHAFFNEVFAALRFGAIMARIAGRMTEVGIAPPWPDYETNTQCHQRLAVLLDLPQPGRS